MRTVGYIPEEGAKQKVTKLGGTPVPPEPKADETGTPTPPEPPADIGKKGGKKE